MSAASNYEDLLAQIKAELASVGRLNPGPPPRQGINLILSSELPPGWIGIGDEEGRQAFGPASEILIMIQRYVRKIVGEGGPLRFRAESFWELMQDFPSEPDESENEA